MKILHVISYFQPELGYQEFYLAKEQQKMGHEVAVLTSDRYYPFSGQWSTPRNRMRPTGVHKEEGLTVFRVPCLEIGTYCLSNRIPKMLRTIRPDVVHAHEILTLTPAIPAFLRKSLKYKYIIDSHAYTPPYASRVGRLQHFIMRNTILHRVARNADAIVAIADCSRRWFSKEFRVPYRDISVIPLGADIELFKPSPIDRFEVRKKLGVDDSDVLITYAGKIIRSKDLHILFEALGQLKQMQEHVKVLIVGSGPKDYVATLREISRKYNLGKRIVFHELVPKERLQGIYNASDIGVWPGSRSITIIEAMATGLPVVVTRNDPFDGYPYAFNAEYYLEYHNGLSFARGNVSELSDCLKELITDEDLRRVMGKRSRKLAEDKLNWNLIARQFLETYVT